MQVNYRKGDIHFVILILQNINVVVLPPFVSELSLIFYTETYIKDFKKICHKSFSMATFSAIMVGIRGHYKNTNNDDFCQVIVADNIAVEDHNPLKFCKFFMMNRPKSRVPLKLVIISS